jgi:hypothetical protein
MAQKLNTVDGLVQDINAEMPLAEVGFFFLAVLLI